MICSELERAFKQCKNRDDAFKLGLVYFDEVILIGAKNNFVVNLDYLNLVEYMDRFNSFAWGSISFEQLHDSLSFAASRRGRGKVEGDDEGDEEEEKKLEEQREHSYPYGAAKDFHTFQVICVAFIGNIGFTNVIEYSFIDDYVHVWAYEKVPQLEKPLHYCKMVDPTTTPRISRWKTTKK
ncbi:hypothetical protein EV2_020845 [Malus domestica]